MIGTKADIAKVLIDGLNGETITQPAATHFHLADVVEVAGMMIAAVGDVAGADAAEHVALAALAALKEIGKR